VINEILFFPVSTKNGHQLSWDLSESKITTTSTDFQIFITNQIWFIWIWKKVIKW